MSRVFIIFETNLDTSIAEKFGEVVTLMDPIKNPLKTDMVSDFTVKGLHKHNFKPNEDYIALTGPNAQVAIMLGVVLAAYHTVRLLIFDATEGNYKTRNLDFKRIWNEPTRT